MTVYFQPANIVNKDMDTFLSGDVYSPMITAYDPYWLDTTQNKAPTVLVHAGADGSQGLNSQGVHVANRVLVKGYPTVNLWDYCAMTPQPVNRVGRTAGPIGRATGVMTDGQGKVGMFLNGFDTPSDVKGGNFIGYGPDIHLQKFEWGPPIFNLTNPSQHLHMACRVQFGKMYFARPAGPTPGVGGQLGWRCTFRKLDRTAFRAGLDELVLTLGFWDSRHIGDPGFNGKDSKGNVTAGEQWVSGTLAPGETSRYVQNYGSVQLQGLQPEFKTVDFYWDVTRQNMLNILEDFGLSNITPEEVTITSTSFNCELYDNSPVVAEFKEGQFGFNFENCIVDIW